MARNNDLITAAVGTVLLVVSLLILMSEMSSPAHSVVSGANLPLSEYLGLLVGVSWLLIAKGFLLWSKNRGATLGIFVGFLGFVFAYAVLTFS